MIISSGYCDQATGFRFLFQPDFPDLWQESRPSAGSQFWQLSLVVNRSEKCQSFCDDHQSRKKNMKLSIKEGVEAVPVGFYSTHRTMDKMSLMNVGRLKHTHTQTQT